MTRVGVVLVNFRGADDTLECLAYLREVDADVVVVDNASGGGDVARLRAAGARVVESPENTGFTGGCNLGAAELDGCGYLAFLNNDARPDPAWLPAALAVLDASPDVACVASKVLSWDGTEVLYGGGGVTFYGHGYNVAGDEDAERDVLFATGAAMVVRAEAFREAGGFDERLFMFFEDVDLGWRLWLLGHRVRYVPSSVVFHKHHSSMRSFGAFREHFLLERNALATLYKNLDDVHLAAFLPAAMALAARRGVTRAGTDPGSFDLRAAPPGGDASGTVTVPADAVVPAYAIDSFVSLLPSLAESRRAIQAARRRGDADVLPLFRVALAPNLGDERFLAGFRAVVEGFGVADRVPARRRVVVATGEGVSARMAGPAIRAWEMCRALAREHEVMLLTLGVAEREGEGFRVVSATPAVVRELARTAEVVVAQGAVLDRHPSLAGAGRVVVVDLYDPYHLEALEQTRDRGEEYRRLAVRESVAVLNAQLARGDFFLCASEKQRDFWLGQLAAVGRLNPLVYDADASLGALLAVVPFGLDPSPPVAAPAPVLRRGPDEQVVLWGGGIYNWFDPVTLVEAMARLDVPGARLHFLGGRHPNPDVPSARVAAEARERAEALGLLGSAVTFADDWVPYAERGAYLSEAAVGVSTHADHVETRFSFRTRVLDYLWAGLPVVCTAGDALADLVEREGLGVVVPPGDPDALAAALRRVLTDEAFAAECRKRVAEVAPRFRWDEVLRPLVEFCRSPRPAPDQPSRTGAVRATTSLVVKPPPGWRTDLRTAATHLREGGVRRLARKAWSRARHTMRG